MLNEQRERLESLLNGASSNLVNSQINLIENRKVSKEQELKKALEEEERNRRIARSETLRKYKNQLAIEVDRQLNTEWPITINQDIRRNLDGNKGKMWSIVAKQYEQAMDNCKKKIAVALQKLVCNNDSDEKRNIASLSNHITRLNNLSKQIRIIEHELSKS